ncbi:MAG: N-acyl homoserine lactonase family protein [Chloroflexi bacterium]|nr:N-acyl homoserine lactonase family protein [Chloroflexota bacterium]
MTTSTSLPQRLYLMQVVIQPSVPCYLVQTSDGKNILIDSGLPSVFPPGFQRPAGLPEPHFGKNVVEQLATLGLQPDAIDILVCTHFDMDHAGNHDLFPHAELVVQRSHYELARGGYPRFAPMRSHWDHPELRYQLVDGDTELLPGIELIETSGHTTGHQSVLVRLPNTGPVLLTIDAVTVQQAFTPERELSQFDENLELLRASTRKLLDLVQREQVTLTVFGHDAPQWQTLKKAPEYYD